MKATNEGMRATHSWTLDEGLKKNELRDREKVRQAGRRLELQERKRAVRPAAIALLRFVYRDVVRASDAEDAERDLRALFKYERHSYVFFARLERRIFIRADRRQFLVWLRSTQSNLRNVVAHAVLSDGHQMGHIRFEAHVMYRQLPGGSIDSWGAITPEPRRFALTGLAILLAAQEWVRFCPTCGRLFFKDKRRLCCQPRCYKVFQGRQRPLKANDGRGRKRLKMEAQLEATHTAWLQKLS